ncbi:MAG: transcriptional regulator [Betaproteobacteria bacterium]
MTKKIKVSELPEFDAAEYLNSEEDIAAYLAAVTEENDPELLASAQEDIARARERLSLEIERENLRETTKPKYKLADLSLEP